MSKINHGMLVSSTTTAEKKQDSSIEKQDLIHPEINSKDSITKVKLFQK